MLILLTLKKYRQIHFIYTFVHVVLIHDFWCITTFDIIHNIEYLLQGVGKLCTSCCRMQSVSVNIRGKFWYVVEKQFICYETFLAIKGASVFHIVWRCPDSLKIVYIWFFGFLLDLINMQNNWTRTFFREGDLMASNMFQHLSWHMNKNIL